MSISTLLIGAATVYVMVSTVLRVTRLRSRSFAQHDRPKSPAAVALIKANGGVAFALAIGSGAPMFLEPHQQLGILGLAVVIFVSSLVNCGAEYRWERVTSANVRPALYESLATALAGCAVLGSCLFLRSVPGYGSEPVHVEFPLRGSWSVVTGGRSRLTNYHHDSPPQQNAAVDLVVAEENGTSEGQDVFSPVVGIIAEVRRIKEGRAVAAEGNLIIIEADGGVAIWLAHLQDNSVVVEKGDRVRVGQRLAEIGSTGSAEEAHLHVHAEKNGLAVPLLFGPKNRFLVRGDVIQSAPPFTAVE